MRQILPHIPTRHVVVHAGIGSGHTNVVGFLIPRAIGQSIYHSFNMVPTQH